MFARSLCLGSLASIALGAALMTAGCATALNDASGGDDTDTTTDKDAGSKKDAAKDGGHNYNNDSAAPGDDDSGIGSGQDDASTGGGDDTGGGGNDAGGGTDTGGGGVDSGGGTDSGGGVDSGGGTDSGGPTCNPSPLGSFTTKWHSVPSNTAPCLAQDVSAYYDACIAGTQAACTAWGNSDFFGCGACLVTNSTANPWGPLVAFGNIVELNLGGCYQAVYGNAASTCAKSAQAVMECEHAACDATCSSTVADLGSCADAADQAACQQYKSSADSQCTSYTSGKCALGSDFKSSFESIAAVFCE